jgi:hypothetical protein
MLTRDPSPTVRAVAVTLHCDPRGRAWTQKQVLAAVCDYFGMSGAGVHRDVAARMARADFLHNRQRLLKIA